MDNGALVKQRRDIAIEHCGPWSTHSIYLGEGVYASDEPKAETRLRRCLQIAADIEKRLAVRENAASRDGSLFD